MANDDAPSPVLYLFHEGKTELGYLQALAKNRDIRIVPMPSVSALSPSAQEPASASCPLKNSAASRNRPTRRTSNTFKKQVPGIFSYSAMILLIDKSALC